MAWGWVWMAKNLLAGACSKLFAWRNRSGSRKQKSWMNEALTSIVLPGHNWKRL